MGQYLRKKLLRNANEAAAAWPKCLMKEMKDLVLLLLLLLGEMKCQVLPDPS